MTRAIGNRWSWRYRGGMAVMGGALVMALTVAVPGSTAAAPKGSPSRATYLVQTALEPVVAYHGGVAGIPATAPGRGHKIDPRSDKVTRYADHLRHNHNAILSRVGGGRKLYDYTYSFDGFAARLTTAQAARLDQQPGVVEVTKDRKYKIDTSSTPGFLGLDAPGGLWEQLGGPTGTKKRPGAGEDIVIGDIDSGIWPSAPSFSARDDRGRLMYGPLKGFHGHCESAGQVGDDSWNANLCNKKLVAARHFDAAWGGDASIKQQRPWEFASPRDYNGHGTHTASTAAGDHGVLPTGAETMGRISGIAPRARIAAYKALWSTKSGSTAQGFASDLVAAIDQAVADGVDVINYSISGTLTDFLDPVEIAFLNAANAGIFVAAAAGNSGPAGRTVAHPGPWLTSVAAGTHDRRALGGVTLGNGTTYDGPSIASGVGPAPLIDAANAALPDAPTWMAPLCYPASANDGKPVLDPSKIAGKIVVCDEGNLQEQLKSRAVKEAGGVGMVLTHQRTPADSQIRVHFVPTVDLAPSDRSAVKAYADTAGATATINQAKISNDAPAPYTASFSSRGPLLAGSGNLLKPDVMAPGQNILAATAPGGSGGLHFNIESGTSMATPHVAGIAALLLQRHPNWSPAMVKSALMTSAYDVKDGPGTDPGVIFSEGGGFVRPNAAVHPGLVYDSDLEDWLAFLCGTTKGVDEQECDRLAKSGHSLDPSDLNMPSIAIGRMSGQRAVTRMVTNVGKRTATYTAAVTGMDGVKVTVSPRKLTLDPGETKAFTVRLERETAPPTGYVGGRLTWTDGTHRVRIPIVARLVRAPDTRWQVGPVAGGPTFDPMSLTGYTQPELSTRPGHSAGDGVGVGVVTKWGGDHEGKVATRWSTDGWAVLDGLETSPTGKLESYVFSTTADGTAVGNAGVWDADGTYLGNRPVRWDAGSTKPTELQGLGTSSKGLSFGAAAVINGAGTIGGEVDKYAADGSSLGRRAVRWEAGRTKVTELGTIGTGADGFTNNWVRGINDDGDLVGYGLERDDSGTHGTRAIRWDAGGTAATRLGDLGQSAGGSTSAEADDINDAGTAVGAVSAYDGTTYRGRVAVRWDAGGTTATELDSLDSTPDGMRVSAASAVNNHGLVVGSSGKHAADGRSLGTRAVAWQPGGTAVTPLEQLEINPNGQAESLAFAVNDRGWIVGQAHSYSDESRTDPGDRAVMWTPDGRLTDLTSLLPADSGWTLTHAMSISDSGWVTGIGIYDPDGAGPRSSYLRLFLLQVQPAE